MNVQRRTEPTQSLLQGKDYTPAHSTDIRDLFAKIKEAARVPQKQSLRTVPAAGRKVA